MNIIIAHGNAFDVETLETALEAQGHVIVGRPRSAEETARQLLALQPDCAFVEADMLLEMKDELDRCSNIPIERGNAGVSLGSGSLPCIVVLIAKSSHRQLAAKAVERGASGCIAAGFTSEEILLALESSLAQHQLTRSLEQEVDELKGQLETRKLVDRAKGVLMGRGLTEEEAFVRLRNAAMNSRSSLRDVAQAVILSDSL